MLVYAADDAGRRIAAPQMARESERGDGERADECQFSGKLHAVNVSLLRVDSQRASIGLHGDGMAHPKAGTRHSVLDAQI